MRVGPKVTATKTRRRTTVIEIIFSIVVVGLLFAVGEFAKPGVSFRPVPLPAIEKRDRFYGIIAAPDRSSVLWMVGADGRIAKSTDRGKSWARQRSGVEESLQSIAAWDTKRAVAVGDGVVLVTDDGGLGWSRVSAPLSNQDNKLLRVRIDPFGRAWAVGVMGMVLFSNDHGKSWHKVAPETDQAWNDVGFSGREVWLVGEFGRMAVATAPPDTPFDADRELQWRRPTVASDRSLTAIYFATPQQGVAVGLEGTILRTADGGATWNKVSIRTEEHLLAVGFDRRRWLATDAKGGLFVSQDLSGIHWRSQRVAADDYAWHTDFIADGTTIIAVGASLVSRRYAGSASINVKN